MPYSGASDPNLPANVKKMPAKKRRQWVHIFNSTMASCEGDDCEGKAFRVANGVLKKKDMELIPIQCECKEYNEIPIGEKEFTCLHCQRGITMTWKDIDELNEDEKCYPSEVSYYRPYGGATSFDEIDAWKEAMELTDTISQVKYQFDSVYENIGNNDEMSPAEKIAAVEKASKEMIKRIQSPPPSMKEKIKNLLFSDKKIPPKDPHIKKDDKADSFFIVTKDTNGEYRWLAIFSNKFKDRDEEIFSEDAHKDYEQWVDQTKNYPSLRLWHILGTDIGQTDMVTYADGFQLAAGYFYKETQQVAASLAKEEDLAVSHGYEYKSSDLDANGVYHQYRTFEISVLPREKAANPWTSFTLESMQQEVTMGLEKEKRDFLVGHIGEEKTAKLEEWLPQLSKELEERGVNFKELAEIMADPDPKSEDEGDGGESNPDPDPEAKADVTLTLDVKAVKDIIEPLAVAVKQLTEDVAALKKTDDEKIAAAMGAQADPTKAAQAKKASESKENVIDPKDTLEPDPTDDPKNGTAGTAKARELVDAFLLGKGN